MIWKHLFGYLPANLIAGLVQFGVVFLYTRLLGADDYGRYVLVLTGMQLTHTIFMTWAEAGGYRFAQEALLKNETNDHIRTTLGMCAFSTIPALIFVALAFANAPDPRMGAAIAWLFLCLPTMTLMQCSLEIRKARQEVRRWSMLTIFRSLAGLGLGVIAAFYWNVGPAAPFIGVGFATLAVVTFEIIDLANLSAGGRFRVERAKTYFTYGLPIAMALTLELGLSAGDRFLIAAFLNEAAVGAYAAGYGVADQTIRLICIWAATAGGPLLLEAWERGGPKTLNEPGLNMSRMMLLLTLPAAIGIAAVAYPLSEFMIGEELREQAAKIIPWIAAAGLLNGWMIYYFSEAFVLSRRTGLRAAMMVVPLVVNIVLNIVLLPRIGLMGAVYATVASYGLAVLLAAFVPRRFAPLPFPFLDAAKTLAACAVMVMAVRLIPPIGGLLELILKAGLGAASFGLGAFAINAAGARDLVKSYRGGNSSVANAE